ncbi:putative solute-binding protein [Leptospira inadai]
MKMKKYLVSVALLFAFGNPIGIRTIDAAEAVDRTMCVFDPSGAHGDVFKSAQRYQAQALTWGIRLDLKAYTDEVVANSDFKAGKCHMAFLTSLRVRGYVPQSGSIEAIGALPSYELLRRTIEVLANSKARKLNVDGEYETMAMFPGGAVYLLLRDKNLKDIKDLAGKKIATLTYDQAATTMVDIVGASMVPAEIATFAGIFNNGRADACYSPAIGIKPLELMKGISPNGGIVRFPIGQLTFQIVARQKDFPENFGNTSRYWAATQFDSMLALTKRAEQEIPAKFWLEVPKELANSYFEKFREVRIKLRDKKVYHPAILKLMKGVRCKSDPSAAECSDNLE